jgi:hypothetical protein
MSKKRKKIDAAIAKLPGAEVMELEHLVYLCEQCRSRPDSLWPLSDGSEVSALVFLAMLEKEIHDRLYRKEKGTDIMDDIIGDVYGRN